MPPLLKVLLERLPVPSSVKPEPTSRMAPELIVTPLNTAPLSRSSDAARHHYAARRRAGAGDRYAAIQHRDRAFSRPADTVANPPSNRIRPACRAARQNQAAAGAHPRVVGHAAGRHDLLRPRRDRQAVVAPLASPTLTMPPLPAVLLVRLPMPLSTKPEPTSNMPAGADRDAAEHRTAQQVEDAARRHRATRRRAGIGDDRAAARQHRDRAQQASPTQSPTRPRSAPPRSPCHPTEPGCPNCSRSWHWPRRPPTRSACRCSPRSCRSTTPPTSPRRSPRSTPSSIPRCRPPTP